MSMLLLKSFLTPNFHARLQEVSSELSLRNPLSASIAIGPRQREPPIKLGLDMRSSDIQIQHESLSARQALGPNRSYAVAKAFWQRVFG